MPLGEEDEGALEALLNSTATNEANADANETAEEAPSGPLAALMAKHGMTEEQAAAVLERAADTDAQEREAEAEAERVAEHHAMYNQRFRKEFGPAVVKSLQNQQFAAKALEHIRAYHPNLLPGAADESDPDPALQASREQRAELQAIRREMAELRASAARELGSVADNARMEAVANRLEDVVTSNPEAQKYESYLISELQEAYRANPRAFSNPHADVPRFIRAKLNSLRLAVGDTGTTAPARFTAPRRASGRPGAAPSRKSSPEIDANSLAAEALQFMRNGGGGVEE